MAFAMAMGIGGGYGPGGFEIGLSFLFKKLVLNNEWVLVIFILFNYLI